MAVSAPQVCCSVIPRCKAPEIDPSGGRKVVPSHAVNARQSIGSWALIGIVPFNPRRRFMRRLDLLPAAAPHRLAGNVTTKAARRVGCLGRSDCQPSGNGAAWQTLLQGGRSGGNMETGLVVELSLHEQSTLIRIAKGDPRGGTLSRGHAWYLSP
jgi:hypothetical protein